MPGKTPGLQAVQGLLIPSFPKSHVSSLLKHFSKAVQEFRDSEWENAIAKSGKFIEAVLKALFVHAGQTLPTGRAFKADPIINGLAQLPATAAHDSVRLTIPRASRFVYDIASNRGGRHDADEIDPNEMDANAVMMACSWILAEMIRVATKGAVDLTEAQARVEALVEKKYPMVEDIDGRMYFHLPKKSAPDVALLALAYRYPKRISKQDLIATVKRNGFTEENARVAVGRILKYADDDGNEQLRLLAPGLKRAEELMKQSAD
jgi:hypothetical protein